MQVTNHVISEGGELRLIPLSEIHESPDNPRQHSADIEAIRRCVGLFLEPGGVVELRVPKTQVGGVISGYFSDPARLADAARSVSGKGAGVYVTLNPVPADLLGRANNRLKPRAQNTTVDAEVLRRRWLLLDFDPQRPTGISATDLEHDAALGIARAARHQLAAAGWPRPVVADSGNGAHLLYRVDLPNDAAATELMRAVLRGAAAKFNSAGVDVDLSVFNAARISKIYGTVAAKGDSTEDRPHRLSRILDCPDGLVIVTAEQLAELAAVGRPVEPPRNAHRSSPQASATFDLERWLIDHSIDIARGPDIHQGSERWILRRCPFNPAHAAPDAAIFRNGGGRLGFKCLHQSCADKGWEQFREFYEPDRRKSAGPFRAPSPAAGIGAHTGDEGDEISVTSANVEEAVDAAIAAGDVIAAMRLAPEVGAMRPIFRAVVVTKLREAFGRRFPVREFNQAMADAAKNAAPPPLPPHDDDPDTPDDGPNLLPFPLTDAGNGERIVALFGREIRYCVEMKRWLVWDGKRWCVDEMNLMRQKAKAMARRLYAQGKGQSNYEAHARATESYAAITAALGSASTEPGVPISAAELDQHPFLLNCPNGVVDLRDGKLLRHNQEFLITKLCPVPYMPASTCPRFVDFLEWAMGANSEAEVSPRTARLVGFLQRAFGYALTSDVSEKAIFILHGERGNNGKTTLLTLFRDLLGRDYSGQLVIDTVMSMRNQDATTRADLADLRGVRLVVTSEVEKEHRLNEGKIKYITAGMGTIKSCRKYENPIEFTATHKLFMDCNHRPRVTGVDDAIWRRLKLIPFEVTVSEEQKDLQLSAKLRWELPGILAWSVRGCIAWAKDGLGDPPEVAEAGVEWREHDDPLKEFLDDCVAFGDEMYVRASDLASAYEWWAKQARERYPLGREGFNERLQAKGLKQSRGRRIDGKQARTWEGLCLRPEVVSVIRREPSMASSWMRDEK